MSSAGVGANLDGGGAWRYGSTRIKRRRVRPGWREREIKSYTVIYLLSEVLDAAATYWLPLQALFLGGSGVGLSGRVGMGGLLYRPRRGFDTTLIMRSRS